MFLKDTDNSFSSGCSSSEFSSDALPPREGSESSLVEASVFCFAGAGPAPPTIANMDAFLIRFFFICDSPSEGRSLFALPRRLRAREAAAELRRDVRLEPHSEQTNDWNACVLSHCVAAGVMQVCMTKPVLGSFLHLHWRTSFSFFGTLKNGRTTSLSSGISPMSLRRSASTFDFRMSFSIDVDITSDPLLTSTISPWEDSFFGSA
mmetsp:Transcript_98736/g.279153  ORF Transcript_98736/g.279153 Transcript_98736/m.279153 type:complete len:206 (-) Transcript_98736:902-1519(-)